MNTKEHALRILGFARKTTLGFVEEIPDDKLCWQPFAGANHVLWNLGHLGTSDEWAVTVFDAKATIEDKFSKLFAAGTTPSPEARMYPSRREVLDYLNRSGEKFLATIQRASDAELSTPLPDEFKGFAPDRLGMLFSLAWHEGFHQGQIAACRKGLGLKPKFM